MSLNRSEIVPLRREVVSLRREVLPPRRTAPSGIERLELELLTRDFVTALNAGDLAGMRSLLHEEVVYRTSPVRVVTGRDEVIEMCREIRDSFREMGTTLNRVAVTDDVVLVDQTLYLVTHAGDELWLMGFGAYRFHDGLIVSWSQIHS